MFAKHAYLTHSRLLLPAIAVSILYVAFLARPTHRESARVATESQKRSAEIENLRLRRQAQQAELIRYQSDDRKLAKQDHDGTATIHVSVEKNEQSLVREFSELLSLFEAHQVECTAVQVDTVDRPEQRATLPHTVTLTGEFYNMLAAMESIESNFPYALATEFSMERSNPSETCRWRITLQLEPEIK